MVLNVRLGLSIGTGVLYDSGNYLYWGGPVSLTIVVFAHVECSVCSHGTFQLRFRANSVEDVFTGNDYSVADPWSGLHIG